MSEVEKMFRQTFFCYTAHGFIAWALATPFRWCDRKRRRCVKPANNPNLCFNLFQPGHVSRDSGEVGSIRGMIEAMVVTNDLNRTRIFISGLSAGGAMAAAILAPILKCSPAARLSLAPYGSATTVPQAFDRMRGHGGPSDRTIQHALLGASDHKGP
jgi:poly(3-hydroxybutyrate) depolymerase